MSDQAPTPQTAIRSNEGVKRMLPLFGALVLTSQALAYTAIWTFGDLSLALIGQLWYFPFIGVLGAIIANTSGTGGGVVYIPVFNILRHEGVVDLTRDQIVASAFAIQCFGMVMGALTWTHNIYKAPTPQTGVRERDFWLIIALVMAISAPVMLATQRLTAIDPRTVLLWFKGFSIVLGIVLVLTTWTVNRTRPARTKLAPVDIAVLALLSLLGGFVTALFSVGVGELVALYLFIRHYPLNTCTATAVIISAMTVVLGVQHHVFNGTVPWEVVALAAPGALLGGFLARRIAHWLGANRLKSLDGGWIILSSMYLIALNV
jgi:uncharacterized membrane protein YfcA